MKTHYPVIVISVLMFLTSCASYIVTTDSLAKQLNGVEVNKGYLFASSSVKGNDLKTIKCMDKNGKEMVLAVTNRTGVRIFKTDSSKVTFYFNTLLIKDSSITGSKTHFFKDNVKPIKFSDISKIKIIE